MSCFRIGVQGEGRRRTIPGLRIGSLTTEGKQGRSVPNAPSRLGEWKTGVGEPSREAQTCSTWNTGRVRPRPRDAQLRKTLIYE
jgi:hypothetical protein